MGLFFSYFEKGKYGMNRLNKTMRILITILFACFFHSAFSQVDTIVWQQLSPLPDNIQRVGSNCFLIDSDFYVAGGQLGASSSSIGVVWKYHIPSDSWMQLQNLPFGPASAGASFALNGKGYFLVDRDSITNNHCDTMFWEYDPLLDSWTIRAGLPDEPRNNSSYFVSGGKGYVGQTDGCNSVDEHFWQYDPFLGEWTQVATLPADIPAGSIAIASLPADAYLFGGYDHYGNFVNDVWRLNISNNQWDSIGQIPGLARCYSSFWGFDSVIIGGGGETSDNIQNTYLANDYYLYDIASNVWTPVVFQNSFDSSSGGATFVFNRRGYYFGGLSTLTPDEIFNNNMWSFDASRFLPPDTTKTDTTGIQAIKSTVIFSLYPNPVSFDKGFSISTSESGDILFYDALGRTLDERKLAHGLNQIKLNIHSEVVFYKATLQDGTTENGKLIFCP